MVSSDTDCIIAETSGTFRVSPAAAGGRRRVRGERRLTLAGMHSRRVRLGSSRYSLNVREIPGITIAMAFSSRRWRGTAARRRAARRRAGGSGGSVRAPRPARGGAGADQPAASWPWGARNAPVSIRSVVSQLMHSSVIETP